MRFLNKKFFFTFLTTLNFLVSNGLHSQENLFSGSIMYPDKKNLECNLDIKIDSFYQITGYCHRLFRSRKLSHYITGQFHPEDRSFYIREYASNKSNCPIFIQAKVYHLMENIYVIAGVFNSLDSLRCDKGHINVINKNFKFNLRDTVQKPFPINEKEELAIMQNLLKQKMVSEKDFISVKPDDKIELNIKEDVFYLKIYDQLKVDGDKVKIVFNEKIISDNLELNEKGFFYKLKPNKGKNILKIYAVNEGKIPMNTSKVELYNDKFHEFYINLLYKKQFNTYIFNYE